MSAAEFLRFCWTQLTSMRTALVLLFALVLAAIPGSLGPKVLPQRPNNPVLVREWITNNPQVGAVFDRLGLFDVYGSPWFAAIYLLLLVSLVGCLIPRIALYARSVRTMPSGVPKRLDRLPQTAAGPTALAASEAVDAGQAWLLSRRYRVRRDGDELSGEIGYLREFGNLLFHISILGVLAGVAYSSLFGFKGSVIVDEGAAFSNTLSQYDDFSSGGLFRPDALEPFTVWVDSFDVSFERGPVQRGAAREFRVHARVADPAGEPRPAVVEVNTPLQFGGSMVNLIGHGYAPIVTVKDAAGNVAFSGPVNFLPQDGNFTSLGIIKAPDARPQRLVFDSVFVPTQSTQRGVGPVSTFPDADAPELWGTVWSGAPKEETGKPENVYSFDKTGLTQVMDGAVPASFRLAPGATYQVPGGGSLTFDRVVHWTKLQVSSTPGLPIVWASVILAVIGLLLALFIRPRRIFARVVTRDGGSRVEVGGLDRADARDGLTETVAGLASAMGVRPDAAGADADGVPATKDQSTAASGSSTLSGIETGASGVQKHPDADGPERATSTLTARSAEVDPGADKERS